MPYRRRRWSLLGCGTILRQRCTNLSSLAADYPNSPNAALDRSDQIGPENSVMVSPEQLRAMGLPESDITAQTHAWNDLSPEMREEQLCRAAQQDDVTEESR